MDQSHSVRSLAAALAILMISFHPRSGIAQPQAAATQASGPLRVHPTNPRYFTDGSGKAIFLAGSHVWENLQDRGTTWPPPAFDYSAYLDFLQSRNHNFMRLWSWEQARWAPWTTGDDYSTPLPFARTGPGNALDGGLKFDLGQFNQAYFDRLRARVIAARDRGIYVSIMLFQGWSIDNIGKGPGNPWPGHPFNAANNVNGINGDLNGNGQGEECHTLGSTAVTAKQEAYVQKVVDTVNDLDNVLYEIANEDVFPDAADWQYHMIDFIHGYESGKSKQHPVWMTGTWPSSNGYLFGRRAEAVAPGAYTGDSSDPTGYKDDPPSNDGGKIIIADTDHIWGEGGDRVWVWKSFTRGLHTAFMDGGIETFPASNDWLESARWAMGQARSYADRMDLASMTPRGDLTSTGFALAHPGVEYLVYQSGSGGFSVTLPGGAYAVEWFDPSSGTASPGADVAGGGSVPFTPPFGGDAVLYLKFSVAPFPGIPDVIVTSFSYSNGTFSCAVKNQGAAATPGGVVIGVAYLVDGVQVTWGIANGPLASGASVSIGTDGGSYVIPNGTSMITAFVDDVNRFAESDETNNTLVQTLTVGGPPGVDLSGMYALINVNSGMALNVYGAATTDGASIVQWPYAGEANSQWQVTASSSGGYVLLNVNSGLALDVYGASQTAGGSVVQWTLHGGANQEWQILPVGDGSFYLLNVNSGQALNVSGASTVAGAEIVQWPYGGEANSRWILQAIAGGGGGGAFSSSSLNSARASSGKSGGACGLLGLEGLPPLGWAWWLR